MRKMFEDHKVLFERGRWLVVQELCAVCDPNAHPLLIWVVHRCPPVFNKRFSYNVWMDENIEKCYRCHTKTPEPVQTIWRLLEYDDLHGR